MSIFPTGSELKELGHVVSWLSRVGPPWGVIPRRLGVGSAKADPNPQVRRLGSNRRVVKRHVRAPVWRMPPGDDAPGGTVAMERVRIMAAGGPKAHPTKWTLVFSTGVMRFDTLAEAEAELKETPGARRARVHSAADRDAAMIAAPRWRPRIDRWCVRRGPGPKDRSQARNAKSSRGRAAVAVTVSVFSTWVVNAAR
jgi:hypothetical protein